MLGFTELPALRASLPPVRVECSQEGAVINHGQAESSRTGGSCIGLKKTKTKQ